VNGQDKPGQDRETLVLSRSGAVELGAAWSTSDHHPSLRFCRTASQECHERLGFGGLVRRLPLGGVAVMHAPGLTVLACPAALTQMSGPEATGKELLCPLYAIPQHIRDAKQVALGFCADPAAATDKPYWYESSRK